MFGFSKKSSAPEVSVPTEEDTANAIRDLVTAHHHAGHSAATVRRALIDLAADHLEPQIRAAVEEVYGCNA